MIQIYNPPNSFGEHSVLRVAGNNPGEPNPWVNNFTPENPVEIGSQCGSTTWLQGEGQRVSVAVSLNCVVTILGGTNNNSYAVTIWGTNGRTSAVIGVFLSSGGSTLVTLSGALGGGLWTIDCADAVPFRND
jgi:hypothetical protein